MFILHGYFTWITQNLDVSHFFLFTIFNQLLVDLIFAVSLANAGKCWQMELMPALYDVISYVVELKQILDSFKYSLGYTSIRIPREYFDMQ